LNGRQVRTITYSDISENEDIRIRASTIIALGKTRDRDAIKLLVEILGNKSEVEWLRGCAAIALGRISGDEVVPPLINALQDENQVLGRAVILALGDIKSEQAIPPLKKILENQSKKELHALTINVLAKIGGCKIISTLFQALESINSQVRCSAALALSDLRTKEAILPFMNLMHDSDECLRAIAASSLGLAGDNRAVELLIGALSDEAETVRTIAASSLGYLGDSRAIAPLEKALDDTSQTVHKQALAALSKLRQAKLVK
jgi:HEAT repeat protein